MQRLKEVWQSPIDIWQAVIALFRVSAGFLLLSYFWTLGSIYLKLPESINDLNPQIIQRASLVYPVYSLFLIVIDYLFFNRNEVIRSFNHINHINRLMLRFGYGVLLGFNAFFGALFGSNIIIIPWISITLAFFTIIFGMDEFIRSRKCQRCGVINLERTEFCFNCGERLT